MDPNLPKFEVGDKVKQEWRGFYRTGRITNSYKGAKNYEGNRLTFYGVTWDGQTVEELGYLGIGFEKVG